MRLFKSDWVDRVLRVLRVPDDVPIEAKNVTNAIANAQAQVESQNFESRKNILKYDDVMDRQRKVVYAERREVLEGADIEEQVRGFIDDVVAGVVTARTQEFAEEFGAALGPLPDGATLVAGDDDAAAGLDLVVFFTDSADGLRARFHGRARSLVPAGMLWIAWPKKTSGVRSDLTENGVREIALERGMVDVKVCAIDATWSGLKLVFRLKDRPK